MLFRTTFAAFMLLLMGLTAMPAQAQHGRYYRRGGRRVIVVQKRRPVRRRVVHERTVIVAPRRHY